MANKDVYDYTLKLDKQGNDELFNETGKMQSPENSISYLLVGVLSCMGHTAISILDKMRINYEKIIMSGKLYMVGEKIRYGNRIDCNMILEGGPDLDDATRDRIAQITKKYCTVSVTIANNPEITLSMK